MCSASSSSGAAVERITVWLARVGFLIIAACTFGLSFDAIRDVAVQTGAVDPSLAWIVPLAVDGMIVTATAVLWTESLSGRGWHIFPLLAIIGPAALSMWANIAHASGTSLLAQVLAAVPPAGLILSLELVAWQIRRERTMVPRFTPAWVDRERRAAAAEDTDATVDDDVSQRASRAIAEFDRQTADAAAADHRGTFAEPGYAPRATHHDGRGGASEFHDRRDSGANRGADRDDPSRRLVVTGYTPEDGQLQIDRDDTGQLQIDRDDTGRLTLDVPSQARGKEVWAQIIAAVQGADEVPTQRQLAAELNVPRSRVRRAIEHNRDEWDELCDRVEHDAVDAPVTAGTAADRR